MDLQKLQQSMTPGEQNLLLLESLIPSDEKFYVWCYTPEGAFVATSCPEPERGVLEGAFQLLGGAEKPFCTPAMPSFLSSSALPVDSFCPSDWRRSA